MFMANSPAPKDAFGSTYEMDITFSETTSVEAPFEYEMTVNNTGTKYGTMFYNNALGVYDYWGVLDYYFTTKDYDKPLFTNELILPGKTATYKYRLNDKFEPSLDETVRYYGFTISSYEGEPIAFEKCSINKVNGEVRTYEVTGISKSFYKKYGTCLAVEVSYDGEDYAFYIESKNSKSYFTTSQYIDLTKLTIKKVTGYVGHKLRSSINISSILLYVLMAIAIGAIPTIVFIVAPAILIPQLVHRGKQIAYEKEYAKKKKLEEPVKEDNLHPEDFDDINRIE